MKKENKKMKMQEIISSYLGVSELVRDKKIFAGDVSLAIAKNFKMLKENVDTRNETAKTVVEKYVKHNEKGEPETKGQQYIFETSEDEKAFKNAMQELSEAEMEIEVQTVPYELLKENDKYSNPTASDLITLDFMLTY